MSERSESAGGGIGLLGMVFIVFLVLKLLGKITWSWWWVTAPLWGGVALAAGIASLIGLGILVVFVGAWLIDTIAGRKRRRP